MKTIAMAMLALGTMLEAPAVAYPGIVIQGPSANGMAATDGDGGNACPAWRCGFNGVSLSGFGVSAVNPGIKLNGLTLNSLSLNGVARGDIGYAATAVTLAGGEVLAID